MVNKTAKEYLLDILDREINSVWSYIRRGSATMVFLDENGVQKQKINEKYLDKLKQLNSIKRGLQTSNE